jgi:hypothetical protein
MAGRSFLVEVSIPEFDREAGSGALVHEWGPQMRREYPDPFPSDKFEDYLEIRGFLVPKSRKTPFHVDLRDPDADQWRELPEEVARVVIPPEQLKRTGRWVRSDGVGEADGIARITNGVPGIERFAVRTWPVTNYFLDRIPLTEVSLRVLALCSLTREYRQHYEIRDPGHTEGPLLIDTWIQQTSRLSRDQKEAREADAPMPVYEQPKSVLTDPGGTPWYPVQVVTEAVRDLSKHKRSRVDDAFLAAVRSVYRKAREDGRSTTLAVSQWHERRTGKTPGDSTVHRWIRLAKDHYGEEF